ncbi:hypothetical protein D9M68_775260 [compost metagenome]
MTRAFGFREHALEQLHHHGADSDEETGSEMPFQDVGQLGRRLDLVALGVGIQLLFGGREHHVATGLLQPGAVGLQGARIGVEIFVGRKLQAVDEDAGHRHITQRLGRANQIQMALVQIAHGGHKSR